MDYTLNIDWSDFLTHYWQKKPCLIKNAFSHFIDPITPEELAGLAMESEIDSRIVTNHNQEWVLEHGPFENFEILTETNATLLVQAVNHWVPDVSSLMAPFTQLPGWRLDDLMISYSTPEGGVGPHVDQYDVFILQGMGKRRWRVGEIQETQSITPHPQLLQIKHFEAIIDEILSPGDLLYIPPHAPHEGYAIEPALNYSIGFRAPNAKELLSGFADFIIEKQLGKTRYYDKFAYDDLTKLQRIDVKSIHAEEVNAMRQMLKNLINDESAFNTFIGEFISQSRHELNILEEDDIDLEEIISLLDNDAVLVPVLGIRVLSIKEALYINGQEFLIPNVFLKDLLINKEDIDITAFNQFKHEADACVALVNIVQLGYWHFEEFEDA